MKKLLLSLFLILLFFTLISCNNEPEVIAPQEMNDEDRSIIDSIFVDIEKENEKEALLSEGEKTELQKAIELDNLVSFSYRNTTVKDKDNSPIATFVIDNTTSTITVEITNASYGSIKNLEGTISYSFSNSSSVFSSNDIKSVAISYIDTSKSETRIEVNKKDDETFSFVDLKNYLYDIYIDQLISEGFEVKYEYFTISLKGNISSDSTNIEFKPISVNITKPLPINDRLYSGKIEMNLYVLDSEKSTNMDANAYFNLVITDSNKATTTINGKVRLSLTISTEESIKFDYKFSLDSFKINNKAINPKEVEEYIKNKISLLPVSVE